MLVMLCLWFIVSIFHIFFFQFGSFSEDIVKLLERSAVIRNPCLTHATLIQFGVYYSIDCPTNCKHSASISQHTAVMADRASLLTVVFYREDFWRFTEHKNVLSHDISPEPGRTIAAFLPLKQAVL